MKLKQKRIEAKMTQTDVAQALGVHQVTYGNYELGKRMPNPVTLKKIAQIFHCTVDELLEDGDDEGRV